MSIFDPLGFLAIYTIPLKILLQDVWRAGIDWDENLNQNLVKRWENWKSMLPKIASVEIPRWYSTFLEGADDIQLHVFVDAEELAYAAAAYLRIQKGGNVQVSLVASKSKVAPLKPISIPRLELQAAVVGTRLAEQILKTPRLKINGKTFWSDSLTVLKWLTMDPRNFKQFVMFRVADILDATTAKEWRWIPSKSNPADLATKIKERVDENLWFCGAPFLLEPPDAWPSKPEVDNTEHTELRSYFVAIHNASTLQFNYEHFSNWNRLYRTVATVYLHLERLKAKATNSKLPDKIEHDFIKKAKNILIYNAQMSEYSHEMHLLKNKKPIDKHSKLISLNVYIDGNKILRSKSRAEGLMTDDAIVLPNNHRVTYLIVKMYHIKYHHIFHEAVINEIRGTYFITRLRALYKSVRKDCQFCKNRDAHPNIPLMASLPKARLAAFERPFTYVGVDYFGPISVAVGRRREKRRGIPREVYTDNGTNFKATAKIMSNDANQIDYTKICPKFAEIIWKFNPPAAPHMGGAWERLIRSIKPVLNSIQPSSNFTDETLRSSMTELEFIINSRPLTFVSIDNADDEALTPNHLLLGSASGYKPISDQDGNLKHRHQMTKAYADLFWKRWVKEYCPMIARRTKWFNRQNPVKPGDIVIIVDEQLPRNTWLKGIILKTIIAKDGQVRRATVKTRHGTLERPAAKLAVLDVGIESSDPTPDGVAHEGGNVAAN